MLFIHISQEVKNPHLRNLLNLFWKDQPFLDGFRKAPASKQMHHAYLGGLMEHTLSLTRLVQNNASHYEGLNIDLLMTGAILHDLGKVYELSYQRSFDYSDGGETPRAHPYRDRDARGKRSDSFLISQKIFSVLLKHLLPQSPWSITFNGSPKKPMTLEAVMLHHLDDMDAKVSGPQGVPEGKGARRIEMECLPPPI